MVQPPRPPADGLAVELERAQLLELELILRAVVEEPEQAPHEQNHRRRQHQPQPEDQECRWPCDSKLAGVAGAKRT